MELFIHSFIYLFFFVCYREPQRVERITLPVGRTEHQRIRFSCIPDNTLHSAGTNDSSDASCLIVSFMFSSRLQCEQRGRGGGEALVNGLPRRREIEMWCVSAKVMDGGTGRMLVFRHSRLSLACNTELQKALTVQLCQVQLASAHSEEVSHCGLIRKSRFTMRIVLHHQEATVLFAVRT